MLQLHELNTKKINCSHELRSTTLE